MAADPLTPGVSERICRHMNKDHADAVLAFARHYGGRVGATGATLERVSPECMELLVDGATIAINFDHTLVDSEDAHRTLVTMLRALPSPGGES